MVACDFISGFIFPCKENMEKLVEAMQSMDKK